MRFSSTLIPMFAGAACAAFAWACIKPLPQTTDENDPEIVRIHIDFPLVGGHSGIGCSDCHVEGTIEQGQTGDAQGWYGPLSTDCLLCHNDTAQAVFAGTHYPGLTCSGGSCHSASDNCWAEVRNVACGEPGVTPAPAGHSGDLAILFPLDLGHAPPEPTCSNCHLGADRADERGKSDQCEACHEADRPADHYGTRACKACHATEGNGGLLQIQADWSAAAGAVIHDFPVAHNTATECTQCHPAGSQNDTNYGCQDGCHQTLPGIHDNFGPAPCAGCHEDGT